MNRFSIILACSAFCVQAMNAAAVYQQAPVWSGNGGNVGVVYNSHVDSTISGFSTFDNFSLNSAAVINQVSWYGIFLGGNGVNGAPNTDHWNINFLSDNAGTPGALLSGTALAIGDVTQTVVGSGFLGANAVTVYQFTANINAFSASAGTQYWFNSLNSATNFSPTFTWIAGSGGNGLSYVWAETKGAITSTGSGTQDRAFTLSNTPEPSTLLMAVPGLLGLAVLRLRKRTTNR